MKFICSIILAFVSSGPLVLALPDSLSVKDPEFKAAIENVEVFTAKLPADQLGQDNTLLEELEDLVEDTPGTTATNAGGAGAVPAEPAAEVV